MRATGDALSAHRDRIGPIRRFDDYTRPAIGPESAAKRVFAAIGDADDQTATPAYEDFLSRGDQGAAFQHAW